MDNYYALLGLSPTADSAAIKKAYHQQLKHIHPDLSRHPDSQRLTAQLNQAFVILSQPQLRHQYDRRLHPQVDSSAIGQVSKRTPLVLFALWLLALLLIYWLQSPLINYWSLF